MSDLVGKTLAGRYRIETFLGKGGMAEVYKVWDQKKYVHLAMKILHADLAEDKIFLRRFEREAQTLAKLQHPNIVRFYSLERDDDLVYMLMDYVEGTTLRKEIFRSVGPFSAKRILEIMKPVGAALFFAHQSGYVHCDVKPANIMLHKNGTVYVSDFGIARVTESATVTMVGAGTPAYMAPEQARGEMPAPQTDIYALGVILFEMLTGGERPFTGENAKTTGSTSEKVRWEQMRLAAPPPSKFNPLISSSLDRIVLKCLEKKPVARYSGVSDLLGDLVEQLEIPGTTGSQSLSLSTATQDEASQNNRGRDSEAPIHPPSAGQQRSKKAIGAGAVTVGLALILAVVSTLGPNNTSGGIFPPTLTPSQTRRPTNTVTSTLRATPIPLPPNVKLLGKTEAQKYYEENENIASLYELAEEKYSREEWDTVGRILPFTVRLSESIPTLLDFGWCTTTEAILADNFKHIEYKITVDGDTIPVSQFVEVYSFSEDRYSFSEDRQCRVYYTILTDWDQGKHQIKIEMIILQLINDGWSNYPAGKQTDVYTVIVE
jgi:serine/threonine protein kinase